MPGILSDFLEPEVVAPDRRAYESFSLQPSGIFERFQYDHAEDKLVVHRVQDVEPILERNKALANEGNGYTPSREMRHVATIPNIVVEQWKKQGINLFDKNDWPKVKKLLNDPENRFLRTSSGRV